MNWLLLILTIPYFITLLLIYTHLRGIKKYPNSLKCCIRVSVIIACRNEEDDIRNILADIAGQTYSSELFEVIVVDDNSTDRTFEQSAGFRKISNLKVLRNNGEGKKMAISTGVDAASGELVITTDADCRVGKSWIGTIASFYNKYYPDMIICPVTLGPGKGFFGKFQDLEFLSLQGITTGSAAWGRSTMCNGANLAFKREIFIKHSDNLHYEILSGDDVFLLHSLKNERGSRIFWLESSDATVTASQAETPLLFLKQRNRWISKGRAYNDTFTIFLAIVTFVTSAVQAFTLIAAIFEPEFLPVFLLVFTLKSLPDFLILKNTAGRYGKKKLLRWFLPSQLVYPFYILGVSLSLMAVPLKRKLSSPFQKGT